MMDKQDIQKKIDLVGLFHDRLGVGKQVLDELHEQEDRIDRQERTVNGVVFDSVEAANEEKRRYVGKVRYETVEEAEGVRKEQARKQALYRKEYEEREAAKNRKIRKGKRIASLSLECSLIAWIGASFLKIFVVLGVVGIILGVLSRVYYKTKRAWFGIIIGSIIVLALFMGGYEEDEEKTAINQTKVDQKLREFSTADGSVTLQLNQDWKIENMEADCWLCAVSADRSEGIIAMQFPKNGYFDKISSMDSVKLFVEDTYSIVKSEKTDAPIIPGMTNIESYLCEKSTDGEVIEAYIVFGETDYAYYSLLYMADKINNTQIDLMNVSYATFIETPIDNISYSLEAENKEENSVTSSQDQKEMLSGDAEGFILPESSSRYLTMEDLEGLDKTKLRLARNEIYAKHGRKYETEDLNEYFSSQSWYHGYLSAEEFDDSVFNEYEKANLDLIRSAEGVESETKTPKNTWEDKTIEYGLKLEDVWNGTFTSDGAPVKMQLGQTENGYYIQFYRTDMSGHDVIWSGYPDDYINTEYGGLSVLVVGEDYSQGLSGDALIVEWDSMETIDHPNVYPYYEETENYAITGSYSF